MRRSSPEKNAELMKNLQSRFANSFYQIEENRGMVVVQAKKEHFLSLMKSLRDDPAFDFDVLMNLTGVDFLGKKETRFEMVYILLSSKTLSRIRVKVALAEDEHALSVIGIWKGANWPEREVYDLMGIYFDGHPLMERLIMPEGYIGYPLRKDFPIQGLGEDYLVESILRPVKNQANQEEPTGNR